MATAAPAPLLNLDTLALPPSVVIDGVPYEIAVPDGLSILEFRRLQPLIVRLEALWSEPDTDEDDAKARAKQIDGTLRAICRLVLRAPASVQEKLKDLHLMAIYQSFMQLPSGTLQRVVGAMVPPGARTTAPTTGASSPPPSRTSTAGRRSSGSRPPRSPLSVPA